MDELPSERSEPSDLPSDSEARFRKIFEHTNDAALVVDPERDAILDVNARACRLLGYSRDELLRLPISAIHPNEMPQFLAFAKAVVAQRSGWTDELTCLTKSGHTLPTEISAAVFELAGRPCVIALVRDVSARKQAEAALQRYSERLEDLVAERTTQLRQSEARHRVLLARQDVRELANVIERAVILSRGSVLELGEWGRRPAAPARAGAPPTLDELQRRHILEVLEATGWQVSGTRGAAAFLGLKPTTLEARMKKLGITRPMPRRPIPS